MLAWALYALFPPPYRAQATVVVDNNLEQAWPYAPDRRLFYFLERETRKLEELAWADTTLGKVASQVEDITLAELRDGKLLLSQPAEGGWHFWAEDADPQRAQDLAAAWAYAFEEQAYAAIASTPELEAARAALQEELQNDPQPDGSTTIQLIETLTVAAEASKGVSPYVEVYVSQAESTPLTRTVSLGAYLFVGSASGAAMLALLSLFAIRPPTEVISDD